MSIFEANHASRVSKAMDADHVSGIAGIQTILEHAPRPRMPGSGPVYVSRDGSISVSHLKGVGTILHQVSSCINQGSYVS